MYVDIDGGEAGVFTPPGTRPENDFFMPVGYQTVGFRGNSGRAAAMVGAFGIYTLALRLSVGATIGSDGQFNTKTYLEYAGYTNQPGPWVDGGTGYLGIQFKIGDPLTATVHYGWARVDYDGTSHLTLLDFAYETTPDLAILAGDTGVPEPNSLLLAAAGAAGIAALRRRRKLRDEGVSAGF